MKKRISFFFCLLTISIFIIWTCFYQLRLEGEKDFISHGLIRRGAIYTLVGDKPVTIFASFVTREKEKINLEENEDTNAQEIQIDRSKLKYSNKNLYDWQSFKKKWRDWKSRHKLSGRDFSLVEEEKGDVLFLHLVNKVLIRKVLEIYYMDISKAIGMDFDIDIVIDNIENSKSLFWTHMMNADYGHICMGLLYGFGMDNAVNFQKFMDGDRSLDRKDAFTQPVVDVMNAMFMPDITIADLPLPIYRMFFDNDPVLEHYKQERARIQREYKDVDLRKLFIEAFKN